MSNANWWNKKLGNPNVVSTTPPTTPAPNTVYRPVQQPNIPVAYDPDQDQLVSKAASSREVGRCPACNSVNYMAPQGTQRKRCYDCGYPLIQAGSGIGGTGSEGPVIPAKQPAQGSGFNPTIIVDRIG